VLTKAFGCNINP
jgi:carboxypeptidase C (cathepsin A)